ncbi:PREDICTED: nanos homolog 1-like [Cyprinodon variegatus]|uniref:nanos homolog 1-like n=1 Tax=Cyprinodon variegatus TaxID=28743 RepID=UPI00074273AD|nr:PREDICTED: nanos homolog 1-like [Cyprinodon variegatus]
MFHSGEFIRSNRLRALQSRLNTRAEQSRGSLQALHAHKRSIPAVSSLLWTLNPRSSDRMDFLDMRSPYDYTFNFWNDYLGLSTLVAKNKINSPSCNPNSITESLKATLGLEDDSPVCSCLVGQGREGPLDCCCCCGAAPGSPPISIYDLKERISLFRPYEQLGGRESPSHGGSLTACDLFSAERRRKQTQRCKPEPKVCVFCRNNGAPEEVYGTHILKTADGRVLCPILRAYTCPLCSANGDNAHTIKYCPLSKDQASQRVPKGGRAFGKRLKIF